MTVARRPDHQIRGRAFERTDDDVSSQESRRHTPQGVDSTDGSPSDAALRAASSRAGSPVPLLSSCSLPLTVPPQAGCGNGSGCGWRGDPPTLHHSTRTRTSATPYPCPPCGMLVYLPLIRRLGAVRSTEPSPRGHWTTESTHTRGVPPFLSH
jgi:hypothetical protein